MAKKKAKKSKGKKKAPKKIKKKVSKKKSSKKPSQKKVAKKKAKATKKNSKKAAPKKTAKKVKSKAKAKQVAVKSKSQAKVTVSQEPSAVLALQGQPLPGFELQNQSGQVVRSADLGGKSIIYFYPKDDTPGCTKEACDFRDHQNRWASAGLKVFGVSPDSTQSHEKFREKYSLSFDLLSDADAQYCQRLGVWKKKSFMGREYMGVERTTLLVNNGIVERVWAPVSVDGHVDDVLNAAGVGAIS